MSFHFLSFLCVYLCPAHLSQACWWGGGRGGGGPASTAEMCREQKALTVSMSTAIEPPTWWERSKGKGLSRSSYVSGEPKPGLGLLARVRELSLTLPKHSSGGWFRSPIRPLAGGPNSPRLALWRNPATPTPAWLFQAEGAQLMLCVKEFWWVPRLWCQHPGGYSPSGGRVTPLVAGPSPVSQVSDMGSILHFTRLNLDLPPPEQS